MQKNLSKITQKVIQIRRSQHLSGNVSGTSSRAGERRGRRHESLKHNISDVDDSDSQSASLSSKSSGRGKYHTGGGILSGSIDEYDDEESQISELQELTLKTGMKPMANRAERFVSVGLNNIKRKKSNINPATHK